MKSVLTLCLILLGVTVMAEDPDSQNFSSLRISHRYDFRTKVNGRYLGLFYGGALGVWSWNEAGRVNARYYLEEQGLRDNRNLEKKLDEDLVTSFSLLPDGRSGFVEGRGGPIFRNFPYRPAGLEWKAGQSWVASGEIALDWDGTGNQLVVPILTEYKVVGRKSDPQGDYWEVSALHALRYKKTTQSASQVESIQGRHETTLQWPENQSHPRFFRMKIDEEIKTAEKIISRSGFWLTWYAGILPLGKPALETELKKTFQESQITDVQIQNGEEGITLTLNNLQFIADQAILLPGEESRLDVLAEALNKLPGRSVVITGYTADVGRASEQDILSEERAKAIVEALKARGVEPKRLYYRGKGANDPVGDNTTAEGRALNRRVEITILED